MGKEWRPVPGFDLYVCNKMGDIKNKKTGHVLSKSLNRSGYAKVQLYNNRVKKSLAVHTIIANVFLGERLPGNQVNHKDGDKTNAQLSNLEYVTPAENMQHAAATGLLSPPIGERNGMSKIKEEDIPKIIEYLAEGILSQEEIAAMFNVSRTTISHIKLSVNWKHATKDSEMDFTFRCKSIERNVPEIRRLLASGKITQKEIAAKFGCDQSTISDIKTGISWGNIQ